MPSPAQSRQSVPGRRPRRRPRRGTPRAHFTPRGQKRRGFTPYRANARPPSGTYDPALDAAERAAGRGFHDLSADAGTADLRDRSDYALALGDLNTQRGRTVEDYGRAIDEQDRSYLELGRRQDEASAVAGVEGSGLGVRAARLRASNKAYERQPLTTALTRQLGDYSRAQGQMSTQFSRGMQDRGTALTRAGRENTFFGQDTAEQRLFQAKQAGYVPPTRPENEHTKGGVTYRVRGKGAGRTYRTASGQVLKRKGFVKLIRRRRKQPGRIVE